MFKARKIKTRVIVRQPSDMGRDRLPVLSEANSGEVRHGRVLGAEHRASSTIASSLVDNEKLVDESRITVVLVVPKVRLE